MKTLYQCKFIKILSFLSLFNGLNAYRRPSYMNENNFFIPIIDDIEMYPIAEMSKESSLMYHDSTNSLCNSVCNSPKYYTNIRKRLDEHTSTINNTLRNSEKFKNSFEDIPELNVLHYSTLRELQLKNSLYKSQSFRLGSYLEFLNDKQDENPLSTAEIYNNKFSYVIEFVDENDQVQEHSAAYMNLSTVY